jgi:ferredoxin
MTIQIQQDLCAGCGACVEACPEEAIHLTGGLAVMDSALCTGCEACVEACPNGAITSRQTLESSSPVIQRPAIESSPILARNAEAQSKSQFRALMPLAGAVLTFLGDEILPRLADGMVSALERGLGHPSTTSAISLPSSSSDLHLLSQGRRRQIRNRFRRNDFRNAREKLGASSTPHARMNKFFKDKKGCG